ncbi:MAG: GGDEF domain-containing protein [Thermomonas sp.]|uniref:GGDEF domain-containing protein n=1 Tax=Thermomonas sp. TaxID=1971895 RepID=UPI0039E32D7F
MSEPVATASWSLRRELTWMLVSTALLPVVVFGGALLWSQWQRDHDELMLRLASSAQSSQNAFDDSLEGILGGVRLLADGAATPEPQRLLQAYPSLAWARVSDRNGIGVAKPGAGAAAVAAGNDGSQPRRAASTPQAFDAVRSDGEALVVVSVPLRDNSAVPGTLQAALPVERLVGQRSRTLRQRGFELILLDHGNRVVHASQGLRWRFADATGVLGDALRRGAAEPGQQGRERLLAGLVQGEGKAYAHAVRMRNGWVVAVIAPEQRLLAASQSRLGLLLGLLMVTTLGILLALWRLRRLLVSSMGRLLAGLHGYALGGMPDPQQLSRMPEELQPLSRGIGELAARLNAVFGELREVLDQREQVIAQRTELLRKAVADLDQLSRTDALTGSLNYRGFQETGERLWREARASNQPLSVLAIDIDHFKRYNDLYGHAEGDGALRRFSGAVRSALLHADDVLARPGGEEFTVFLPGAMQAQAIKVGERICQRVRDADILHAGSPMGRMTVSVGVATLQAGDGDIEDMLRRADEALYRAKHAGRDRVCA